jgi:hypothetical protein
MDVDIYSWSSTPVLALLAWAYIPTSSKKCVNPKIVNYVKLKLKIFGSHQVHFDDNLCQGLVIIVICLYNEQLCLTHLCSYGSPPNT